MPLEHLAGGRICWGDQADQITAVLVLKHQLNTLGPRQDLLDEGLDINRLDLVQTLRCDRFDSDLVKDAHLLARFSVGEEDVVDGQIFDSGMTPLKCRGKAKAFNLLAGLLNHPSRDQSSRALVVRRRNLSLERLNRLLKLYTLRDVGQQSADGGVADAGDCRGDAES